MSHRHRARYGEGTLSISSPSALSPALTLDLMLNNSVVEVVSVHGHGVLSHRLKEMGFIPGTVIRVIRRAPLADPIEYELKGYLISLRSDEARLVEVRLFGRTEVV